MASEENEVGPFEVQKDVRQPWRRYLDRLEPHRPDLYRYCRGLTGNIWDAEDLTQDVLLRVFGLLGKIDQDLKNPRSYLIRSATHLWIDRTRRFERERLFAERHRSSNRGELSGSVPPVADALALQGEGVRQATQKLFSELSPQERAAILIKEVFDLSLAETASTLRTTVGAVKAALHRGRKRLRKTPPLSVDTSRLPTPEIVESFRVALSTQDLEAMRDLCLDGLTIELVGGAVSESFEEGQSFFQHAHMVFPELGFGENPNWRVVTFEGETLVLGFRTLEGEEGLNEIHRLETTQVEGEEKIAVVRCYCFAPETLKALAEELELPVLSRPYRSPDFG